MSALGSGHACPMAIIAFCPFGRSLAPTQCESCSHEQFLCLWPLHLRALQILLGQAYIMVSGHSLPVLHCVVAPFGHTWSGSASALG